MYRRIFFITCATSSENGPVKNARSDNEIGMPNFFAVRTERINDRTAKGISDNMVYISWQTASENHTRHFELERSENGLDFYTVKIIMAAGVSKDVTRYMTTNLKNSFFNDKLYYRLKLVFKNGSVIFTEVITLDLNTVGKASVYDLTYNMNMQ